MDPPQHAILLSEPRRPAFSGKEVFRRADIFQPSTHDRPGGKNELDNGGHKAVLPEDPLNTGLLHLEDARQVLRFIFERVNFLVA
jgi:hypothetical protein